MDVGKLEAGKLPSIEEIMAADQDRCGYWINHDRLQIWRLLVCDGEIRLAYTYDNGTKGESMPEHFKNNRWTRYRGPEVEQ
jgi:hypothetical protein